MNDFKSGLRTKSFIGIIYCIYLLTVVRPHPTQAEEPSLAGPCLPFGGRPFLKGPSLWKIGNVKEVDWETPAVCFKDICKRDLKALAINVEGKKAPVLAITQRD